MKKIVTLLCLLCISVAACAETEKPNILFLFADDQTWNSLGVLDDCPIETPNLDRLRKQGALFTHAYNQGSFTAAVCVASRTMLNTGSFLWQAATYMPERKLTKKDPNDPQSPAAYSIPRGKPSGYWGSWMKQAGYETYFSGKWHVPGVSVKDLFDYSTHIRGGMPNQTPERYQRTFEKGKADIWSPYDTSKGGFWKGGKHWSEVLGDDGVAYLEQVKSTEKPFFMYLAFNAPHDPRQSPKRFVDQYPAESIDIPENFLPEYPYNEEAGAGRNLRDERLAPFPRTRYSVQVNRQEYYAIITHMDEQIGRILDALEASGKADNTYIIFTADHGLAVGDHGFVGKQNMYDASMRVPFLIAGPKISAGKTVDASVYLQDAMATALEIAGIEKPEQVEFNSLLSLATGVTTDSFYPAIYGAYYGNQRMYRTDRYKMIIYPTAKIVRLYDLSTDPDEIHDLANGPTKPVALLNQLFGEFQVLQKNMNDPLDVVEAFNVFMKNN